MLSSVNWTLASVTWRKLIQTDLGGLSAIVMNLQQKLHRPFGNKFSAHASQSSAASQQAPPSLTATPRMPSRPDPLQTPEIKAYLADNPNMAALRERHR